MDDVETLREKAMVAVAEYARAAGPGFADAMIVLVPAGGGPPAVEVVAADDYAFGPSATVILAT